MKTKRKRAFRDLTECSTPSYALDSGRVGMRRLLLLWPVVALLIPLTVSASHLTVSIQTMIPGHPAVSYTNQYLVWGAFGVRTGTFLDSWGYTCVALEVRYDGDMIYPTSTWPDITCFGLSYSFFLGYRTH